MAENIPGVDAAEVAALERAADTKVGPGKGWPADYQEVPVSPGGAAAAMLKPSVQASVRQFAEGLRQDVAEVIAEAKPKGALESLVEQAVSKEFAGIREDLADLKRWGRHTMHLVMVLAHILRVGEDEIEAAKNKVNAADAAFRKGPQ